MKETRYIFVIFLFLVFCQLKIKAQINNGAPYCVGTYSVANPSCVSPGPSNAPGNGINDFINSFNTCGANTDILNNNSGCNGLTNNYIYYNNSNPLVVAVGQTITCNLQSGLFYSQGFSIFIDWNNNGVFDLPSERVAATVTAPGTAGVFVQLSFVVPANVLP